MSPSHAARELLLVSLGTTATDAAFLAAAKAARAYIAKIAYKAGAHAMRQATNEIIAEAHALGVPMEEL
jgi:hypothetical protein